MNERDFQNNVIELAGILGWRIAHFRPARTKHGWRTPMIGDPGFPDLVLARGGRVIFAELKSEKGKLTDEQRAWLLSLDQFFPRGSRQAVEPRANPEVYVWRPSQLEEIKEVLS